MKLVAKVNRESHILLWLKAWNGGLGLTEKELELAAELLLRLMKMTDDGIKDPYLSELLFNTKSMGEVKAKLGLTKQGFNNYKKALKDKKVILGEKEYYINPKLIPEASLTFEFNYG